MPYSYTCPSCGRQTTLPLPLQDYEPWAQRCKVCGIPLRVVEEKMPTRECQTCGCVHAGGQTECPINDHILQQYVWRFLPSYTCPGCDAMIVATKPRAQWLDPRCPVCGHEPLTPEEMAQGIEQLAAWKRRAEATTAFWKAHDEAQRH